MIPADTKLTQHFKRCLGSSTLSIGRRCRDGNERGTDFAGLRNGRPAVTALSSASPFIFHMGISSSSGRTFIHGVRGRTRAEPALFVDKVSFVRTLCHLCGWCVVLLPDSAWSFWFMAICPVLTPSVLSHRSRQLPSSFDLFSKTVYSWLFVLPTDLITACQYVKRVKKMG